MIPKNQKKLNSFIDYCRKHPEERFWQALRNWSGYSFILAVKKGVPFRLKANDSPFSHESMLPMGTEDTFYIE